MKWDPRQRDQLEYEENDFFLSLSWEKRGGEGMAV